MSIDSMKNQERKQGTKRRGKSSPFPIFLKLFTYLCIYSWLHQTHTEKQEIKTTPMQSTKIRQGAGLGRFSNSINDQIWRQKIHMPRRSVKYLRQIHSAVRT